MWEVAYECVMVNNHVMLTYNHILCVYFMDTNFMIVVALEKG